MKTTFKNFLTESDDFTNSVAELKNDPYEKDEDKAETDSTKGEKLPLWNKVFKPAKWRKYLQYANAANN